MSFIQFANGLRIEFDEAVKADELGVVRMRFARLMLGGETYEAKDVVIETTESRFSYAASRTGPRMTWDLIDTPIVDRSES